jgi:hypothetical protein
MRQNSVFHYTSTDPVAIDFEAFCAYIAGFTTGEIVDDLLNRRTQLREGAEHHFSSTSRDHRRRRTRSCDAGLEHSEDVQQEAKPPGMRLFDLELAVSDDMLAFECPSSHQPVSPAAPPLNDIRSLLAEYVDEQVMIFDVLIEHWLPRPYAFLASASCPMPLEWRLRAVRAYYDLDVSLAEVWFGDRMARIDLEDDELEEIGPALRDENLRRQWSNAKRVSKLITAGYRGRDGVYISPHMNLQHSIQQCFGLSPEQAKKYATFVFGFEHRLDLPSLESLSFDELSSLCSALSLWCDESKLLVSDSFCAGIGKLGCLLSDSRVTSEIHVRLFGETPRLFPNLQDKFDEVQKKIETAATRSNAATPAVKREVPFPVGEARAVSGGRNRSSTFPSGVQPVHQYSRRFASEFQAFLRIVSKISVAFGANHRIRDVIERFHRNVFAIFLQLGKEHYQHYHAAHSVAQSASPTETMPSPHGQPCDKSTPSGVVGAMPTAASPLRPTKCADPKCVDGMIYVRELSHALRAFDGCIQSLQSISARDHDDVDECCRDFFAVIRLYVQLLLAHEC